MPFSDDLNRNIARIVDCNEIVANKGCRDVVAANNVDRQNNQTETDKARVLQNTVGLSSDEIKSGWVLNDNNNMLQRRDQLTCLSSIGFVRMLMTTTETKTMPKRRMPKCR